MEGEGMGMGRGRVVNPGGLRTVLEDSGIGLGRLLSQERLEWESPESREMRGRGL